jgi:outer membrane lipoprotein carrier protein
MRITAMLLTLTFVAGVAAAGELDNAVKAMSGNEARFTQHFTPKGFKTAQSESGSVVFGTLPQMRWSYAKPEQKLFVFDGANSWFYIPADKQVTVGRIDDARKRELPFLLLGDVAARGKYFTMKEARRGNNVVATLQPRDASAMIRNIDITIAPSTHLITHVEYTDREGNRTAFDFSGYRGGAARPDLFRFTPPAGVQVVKAE